MAHSIRYRDRYNRYQLGYSERVLYAFAGRFNISNGDNILLIVHKTNCVYTFKHFVAKCTLVYDVPNSINAKKASSTCYTTFENAIQITRIFICHLKKENPLFQRFSRSHAFPYIYSSIRSLEINDKNYVQLLIIERNAFSDTKQILNLSKWSKAQSEVPQTSQILDSYRIRSSLSITQFSNSLATHYSKTITIGVIKPTTRHMLPLLDY